VSERNSHIEIQVGSERSFGLVFAFVFALIGLYPLLKDGDVHLWALVLSAVFGLLGIFAPRVLAIPNRLWFKLGMLLGAIVAPIVMALVYLLTVLPIGLCFRLLGKDLLNRKLDRDAKSYWIEREQPVGSMKDQF
jgi:predicted membrane metal-binding protein